MTVFEGYQLGSLLGRGTFGETFEATKGGERVALKLIKEEAIQQEVDRKRFNREVRSLQKCVGPNVVKFIDSGVGQLGNETRYYVAMEFLEGQDLAKAFRSAGTFGEAQLRQILTEVLDGLNTVHEQNIIHRDLKPANVFLTSSGTIKLLDFGLVKMLDYTTLTTIPGQPIGTPVFMAPEILGPGMVDYRADFYSFGVLIYHLVTGGQYPLTARTPLELFVQIVNNPPTPPTRYNRKLSSEFENLILTLLSKQPYQRRYTYAELKSAIEAVPLYISDRPSPAPESKQKIFTKRCFFNLLPNEKSEITQFVEAGGQMHGVILPANLLPQYKNTLDEMSRLGVPYFLDPVTYRLAYSTFSQTQGLVKLPYVYDKNNILTPEALQTLSSQQKYAQDCLNWQFQWNPRLLIAPFHFCRDLNSSWVDIDIKLTEEAIAYGRSLPGQLPVYAGMCLNIEAYTVESRRLELLNRYSRANADGYYFLVEPLDERASNTIQINAYLELIRLFKQLGKPVIAARVGTLGLGLLASGCDGITSGIAALASFSESNLLANRTAGYDMAKKYYIPEMMISLPVPMAQDILSDSRNAAIRCNCPHCQGSSSGLSAVAKPHFLYSRLKEIEMLAELTDTPQRLRWFADKVNLAYQTCEEVRRQQVVTLQSSMYSHFRVWVQVFSPQPGGAA